MKRKKYKQKRVLKVLRGLGFKILNEQSDAPVFFLQLNGGTIVSIDRYEDDFLEDYLEEKFSPIFVNFNIFKYLYEQSKKDE